jgi:lambda family phage minor tail protein L
MSQNIIAKEAQALQLASDEALVTLFEFSGFGTPLYFHSENTQADIYWNGNAYEAFPMLIEGIEKHADGASARPTLMMPNVESLFKSGSKFDTDGVPNQNSFLADDLLGKRVTIRKTLSKYVSEGTNTNQSPFEFPKAEYVIDRIAQKTSISLTVELASPFELQNVKVPSRVVTGKYCPWIYKGWTTGNVDVKSACHWTSKVSGLDTNGNEVKDVHLFFTIDDEPLVHEDIITAAPNWSAGTTYSLDSVITHDNLKWQSFSDDNTGNTPNEHSPHWRIVRTYRTYNIATAYQTNSIDGRKSDYAVELINGAPVVFRCVRDHTNKQPSQNPGFWVQADVCGKLLSSCKARYQATNISSGGNILDFEQVGTIKHGMATAKFNTAITLPFGGFPGTRSFR